EISLTCRLTWLYNYFLWINSLQEREAKTCGVFVARIPSRKEYSAKFFDPFGTSFARTSRVFPAIRTLFFRKGERLCSFMDAFGISMVAVGLRGFLSPGATTGFQSL